MHSTIVVRSVPFAAALIAIPTAASAQAASVAPASQTAIDATAAAPVSVGVATPRATLDAGDPLRVHRPVHIGPPPALWIAGAALLGGGVAFSAAIWAARRLDTICLSGCPTPSAVGVIPLVGPWVAAVQYHGPNEGFVVAYVIDALVEAAGLSLLFVTAAEANDSTTTSARASRPLEWALSPSVGADRVGLDAAVRF